MAKASSQWRWTVASLAWAILAIGLVASPALAHPPLDHQIEKVTHALAERPADSKLLLVRSDLYRRLGRLEEALQDAQDAIALDTSASEPYVYLARAHFDGGHWVQTVSALSSYFQRGGSSYEANLLAGRATAAVGDLAAARSHYETALAIYPAGVEARLAHARLLIRLDDLPAAQRSLEKGLAEGEAVVLRDALVHLELQRGHWQEALQSLAPLLLPQGNQSRWLLLRARAYTGLGNEQAATRDRQLALEQARGAEAQRHSAMAELQLAEALVANGERAKGLALASRVVRSAPSWQHARTVLSELQSKGKGAR